MKRLIFPITLILMAALFLSACSAGGTTVNETPGVPQTGETSVVGTPTGEATTAITEQATSTTGASTAGETSTPAGTSTSTSGTVGTSTPSVGTGTSTSTGGMTGTSTPSTGTGTSGTPTTVGTPSAGTTSIPVTGATESYVRLSTLLNGTVSTSDGTNVGTLAGVLVQHPVIPAAAAESTGTPVASPTPAPTLTEEGMAFTVRYVLVDVSNGASTSGTAGSSGNAGNSAAQTGNGRLVVIPWQAFDFSTVTSGSAKLNVAGTAISGAPHFTLPDVASTSGPWFGQLNSYWAGQNVTGFTAPNSKSLGEANLSLITRDFRDMAITGPNGEDFGRVSDLLIDPTTGQVLYAVFSGGADLNNQVFVIPVNLLDWTAAEGGTQLGSFAVNVPLETLQKSPVFQSLQNLTLDPNTVQQLQNFWNSVTPSK